MNLLELTHVSRRYDNITAVDSVTFSVQQGQFITLLGPSGCGKTTTLRLIAGFEVPDTGSIQYKNHLLAAKGIFIPPKDRQIGMVFQDYALFPHLNVADNVGFGLQMSKHKKIDRVAEMLELVGMQSMNERMPFELSGGQQQRVALARALAPAPGMLLLDEPFSSLDAALRAKLRSEMRTILRQTQTTCIFVTHSQDEALSLSDSIAVMFNGKIVQIDSPENLYTNPVSLEVATFIGEANLITGEAQGNYIETILGKLTILEPYTGHVKALIRPEQVRVCSDQDECGIEARPIWREYYGHDQRVGFALTDGTALTARMGFSQSIKIGEACQIRVEHPVKTYPA